MNAPLCGFWGCRGARAVARVWFPLDRPFSERSRMDVCDPHWTEMARMFGTTHYPKGS